MFRWYAVHIFRTREQGQAEPRAPRGLAGPAEQRAPDRDPDRERLGDEGWPEGPDRAPHDAGLRAREHGPERGLLDAREGHAGRDRVRGRPAEARAALPDRDRPP